MERDSKQEKRILFLLFTNQSVCSKRIILLFHEIMEEETFLTISVIIYKNALASASNFFAIIING